MDGIAQEEDAEENVGEELQGQEATDLDRGGVYETEEVCFSFVWGFSFIVFIVCCWTKCLEPKRAADICKLVFCYFASQMLLQLVDRDAK